MPNNDSNRKKQIHEAMQTALLWADAQFPIEYGEDVSAPLFAMVNYDIRQYLRCRGRTALEYIGCEYYRPALNDLIAMCADESRGMHDNKPNSFLCYQEPMEILKTFILDNEL